MRKTTDRPICHRAEDMVAFLYGEASPADADDFANHMSLCAACRTEFSGLAQVHESMSHWRAEVLDIAWRPEPFAEAESRSALVHRPRRKLSAIAALREFFVISPVWLQGATAMASILFCVLAALFVARMLKTPEQLYTQQEVNAQVQNSVETIRKEKDQMAGVSNVGTDTQGGQVSVSFPVLPSPLPTSKRRPVIGASRRFLSRAEREQLAADLRLKPGDEEEDLSLLLDGGSN